LQRRIKACGKIAYEKWLIRPILPASLEIASENTAIPAKQLPNGGFLTNSQRKRWLFRFTLPLLAK